jgi:murein DD-endopeptidase MepM/ murein hydrolase activator NlpD
VRHTDPSGNTICLDGEQCYAGSGTRPGGNGKPHFTKSPVSEEDLEWTQWFGGTEFAKNGGSDYGYDKYCQGYHCGIDFGANWGDPVYAGVNHGYVYDVDKGNGGYYVVVKSGDYYILYQALDGNFSVKEGDVVTSDTILAGVGNHAADVGAGNYHLHLEVMHYSPYAVKHNSFWEWRGDLIENPLKFMSNDVYALLVSVVESSPPNNVTFHSGEQNPLLQPSPMHRGGTILWP